jgi:drug/metabolite transporter (DMT)-like permease
MRTRRTIGIVAALVGLAISLGHIILAFFSSTPERYHGHEVIVTIGIVLALGGVLLIGTDRQE